jgi:hypothetical protein
MSESFLRKSEGKFLALLAELFLDGIILIVDSKKKSYLDASCTKPWLSVTLGESFRGCFRYRTFLLNLLKVDSMNHVLTDLVL